MTQVSKRVSPQNRYATYFTDFEALKKDPVPPWLRRLKMQALDRFKDLGIPVTRELQFPEKEDWLFTNLAPIANIPFSRAPVLDTLGVTRNDLAPYTFGDAAWTELVFVNGIYAESLSTTHSYPGGVTVQPISNAKTAGNEALQGHLAKYADYEKTGLTALNTAFLNDGVFIQVPEGKMVEHPIHILYVSADRATPTVTHPRTLVVADPGASVTVLESYIGLSEHQYFTNAVTELVTGQSAVIDHYRINRESLDAFHTSMTQTEQHGDSNISTFNMCMGGALTRNDTQAHLNGEHIVTRMNGLYLVTGTQHVDNHTAMDHAKPNCNSYEVYKGILDGHAHAVFNGKVFVREDAQETDAKQLNKNLLLSPTAAIDTKPQLEIFADQVKCTHGATVGQLDEDQVFYSITRGMSREVACSLLTYGFAADLIRRLKVEAIREQLDALLEESIKGLAETRSY